MGVDISGRNPILRSPKPEYPDWNSVSETERTAFWEIMDEWEDENPGDYFRSNWWGWRPIVMMCEYASDEYELNIDFSNWGSNDGAGLETQEECTRLAGALEDIMRTSTELEADIDSIYLCLGSWVNQDNQFVGEEKQNELNQSYQHGEILYGGVVGDDGTIYYPSHSCSKKHLQNFINFLKECGGFEIW